MIMKVTKDKASDAGDNGLMSLVAGSPAMTLETINTDPGMKTDLLPIQTNARQSTPGLAGAQAQACVPGATDDTVPVASSAAPRDTQAGKRVEDASLRIVQINMQRSRLVSDETRDMMHNKKIDVLLMQEPYNLKGRITGLGLATRVATAAKDGEPVMAAVAVSDPRINVVKLPNVSNSHCVCVHITCDIGSFYLVSMYFQCSHEIGGYLIQLSKVLDLLKGKPVLVAADANAKSPLWGSKHKDTRGGQLEEIIAQFDLVVLNESGNPCTYSSPTGNSNIDVTLVTPEAQCLIRKWKVQVNWTSSDHRAIVIEMGRSAGGDHLNQPPPNRARFDIRRADWQRFQEVLQSERDEIAKTPILIENREDVERMALLVEETIVSACQAAIPPKGWRRKAVPWWSNDLTKAKKGVYDMRRIFQAEKDETLRIEKRQRYHECRKAYVRKIRSAKAKSWREFVTKYGNEEPWGTVYKINTEKLSVARVVCSVKNQDNTHALDWKENAKRLLDALIPDDDAANETTEQREIRNEIKDQIEDSRKEMTVDSSGVPDASPFTMFELEEAVKTLRKKKCPGPDRIEVEVLQMAWPQMRVVLLELYNACLEFGVFPVGWKKGEVITLLKGADRDESLVKSYRPICLLSVMGKVLEKLIASRLAPLLTNEKFASKRQYGFTKSRSTEDAVVRLRTVVSEAEEQKMKYVLAVAFDISGAFDNVWWPSVMRSLIQRKCPGALYRLMESYFTDRQVAITTKYGAVQKQVTKGCPQGSVLGPRIWNLVFDGLLEALSGYECIAYADDLLVLISGNSRVALETGGQAAVDKVQTWCKSQKLELSAQKTEMILLRGSLNAGRPPGIKVGGKKLALSKSIRYLGVYLDAGMKIKTHVDYVSSKCQKAFLNLSQIAKASWGLNHKTMTTLYKGLFIPIVTYASAGWVDLLNAHTRRTLVSAQRQALLRVSKAYRTISNDALQVITGEMPIDLVALEKVYLYKVRKRIDFEIGGSRYKGEDLENGIVKVSSVKKEIREFLMRQWQERWDGSDKGRTTHQFFPDVTKRVSATEWIHLDHHVVQLLSGHGDFRAKLMEFKLVPDDKCGCGATETSTHVIFECPRHEEARQELRQAAAREHLGWPVNCSDLVSKGLFRDFKSFSKCVLRSKEQERARCEDDVIVSSGRTPG